MNGYVQCCDLYPDELPPVGKGFWRGDLADNPSPGLAPVLTWSLTFAWPLSGSVDVTIEGIPANVASWREIEGTEVESTELCEPIYSFAYDGGCHFEFEYAHIRVLRQVGTMARFAVVLAEADDSFSVTLPDGEILETDQIHTTVDAEFEGIFMHLTEQRELAEFTDTAGLVLNANSGFHRLADSDTPEHSGH